MDVFHLVKQIPVAFILGISYAYKAAEHAIIFILCGRSKVEESLQWRMVVNKPFLFPFKNRKCYIWGMKL